MSVISMMEMNAKSPYLWDWENLVMLNTKSVVETPKKLQLVDSEIEGIEEGFEIGSLYSSGGTGSDLGYASSSRSSKSASVDSSTNPVRIRSRSVASGESIVALELGKRTYFEDVSAAKKSKKATLNTETPPPLCQVEGCNLDISSAKDYHRKHRVCESHSKSSKVVINGLERRFCQQCSRFHSLSEFDQKKRSCRRRLSDHNARRRKPKPEIIQFNSMKLASSLYEGRNHLSFGFKQGPVIHTRHGDWDSINNSKVEQPKSGLFTNIKTGVTDELHSTQNGVQNPETKVSPVSTHFLSSKGSSSQVFQQGLPVSMDATQDLRALSLLSTSSWGSCDTQPSLLHHSLHTNQPSLSQPLPVMHAMSLVGPPVSSEYWQPEQPVTSGPVSHSSTFQLFKAPDEPSYYLY